MTILALLVAQSTTAKPTGSSGTASLVLLVGMGALFYFLLIRPQKTRVRQQQELMRAVEAGDEIETVGGIFGIITRAEEDQLWLEIAPGTTVKISRAAIRRKVYAEEPEEHSES
jgi:preprotein translocase subunit YajC